MEPSAPLCPVLARERRPTQREELRAAADPDPPAGEQPGPIGAECGVLRHRRVCQTLPAGKTVSSQHCVGSFIKH